MDSPERSYKKFAAGLIVAVGEFNSNEFARLPASKDASLMEKALRVGCQLANVEVILNPTMKSLMEALLEFKAGVLVCQQNGIMNYLTFVRVLSAYIFRRMDFFVRKEKDKNKGTNLRLP